MGYYVTTKQTNIRNSIKHRIKDNDIKRDWNPKHIDGHRFRIGGLNSVWKRKRIERARENIRLERIRKQEQKILRSIRYLWRGE